MSSTDTRQPKPNTGATEPAADQPSTDTPPPKPAPPKQATKPKGLRLKRTPKVAEEPLKLPRLGETQRLALVGLPTISVTELAERLDVTRPAASRALHALTTAGLATPSDGQNRGWKSAWKLTRLGERVAAELSFDSVRRVHELVVNRPHNLPAEAETVMADAEVRLGSLLD